MKRMIVFTRPSGRRFAVAVFDIRHVYELDRDPNSCRVFYQDFGDVECSELVVGTFDDIVAQIEETVK